MLQPLAIALSLTMLSFDLAVAAKPNIIVVLVDDMGFSDIGCYGGEIPTPHIDSLAAGGLRFTQFYNMGRCCPTRASLLTGLYPHQAGIGDMTVDEKAPSYRGYLNNRCVTLGEELREAGYFTAHTGKWHVGEGDVARLPLQRGFDRFFGTPEGGGFYFRPKAGRTVVLGNEVLYTKQQPPPADWYSTDAWTDCGLRFIDEARARKQPFFPYLAYNAPHDPLQAPPGDIARFRGRFKAGWDTLREQRHQRQIDIGLVAGPSSKGSAAVRDGDWKLVRMSAGGPWELFDLTTDRQETHDLASGRPERVRSLAATWEEWARRVAAKPFIGQP